MLGLEISQEKMDPVFPMAYIKKLITQFRMHDM